jgi:hypothetical protein
MSSINLVDSKKDVKNTKWDGIFTLYEFNSYLAKGEFIEIISLNKLLREKLKHKVFYKINISHKFLLDFPNYIYYKKFDIKKEPDVELQTTKNFQNNIIDPFITDLIKGLNTFCSHLKQIEFSELFRSGYFIVPLVSNFNNLTSLSISECELDLKIFNDFILKFYKLEFLSIKYLMFLTLNEEWPLVSQTLLPQTLKELELGSIRIMETDLHKSLCEFLNEESWFVCDCYYIPVQHLPYLKHLIITKDIAYNRDYIPNILKLNPQLTCVTFPCYYLSPNVIESLSVASNINEIQIVFKYDNYRLRDFDIMPLDSVNTLSIKSIPSSHFHKVYTIIELFPKITKFYASFGYFDNVFFAIFITDLKYLKNIELEIDYYSDEELDLSILSNIETLKLDFSYRKTIRYKLPTQPSNLKLIKITSKNYLESFNFMLEDYKGSSIWNITLLGEIISCVPITN